MNKKAVTQIVMAVINIIFGVLSARGIALGDVDPAVLSVAVVGVAYQLIAPLVMAWRNTPVTKPAKLADALIKAGKKGWDSLTPEENEAMRTVYEQIKTYYE
jgi:hypothetical protein